MTDPVIQVEGVFKKFRRGDRHESLRDAVAAWFRLGRPERGPARLNQAEFWALQDVNFRVQRGEAFGVIGPNGAGKSTLLKLLAGIMRPNQGRIAITGRVSALIEVGAGFHPDLTGRENIYLNASILGMSRSEVQRKFDEIVEFAGIRDFLDTPIKRYSSGMYARLGFSVAAHVEPELLLVDEVLSVGDRMFRAKCIDKMKSFLKRGVGVVFVSHDLTSVGSFCDRAMVLAAGRTLFAGPAHGAIAQYHKACIEGVMLPQEARRPLVRVGTIRLIREDGLPSQTFRPGERLAIEFDVRFEMDMRHPSFGLSLIRADDRMLVFETSSTRMGQPTTPVRAGTSRRVRYDLTLNVSPGEYCIGYHVRERDSDRYAAISEDEARVMVVGESSYGGHVHMAPTVCVNPAADGAGAREAEDVCVGV